MTYRDDIAWRNEAHAKGFSTNLDGIPTWMIRLIHFTWRIQDLTQPFFYSGKRS